MTDTHQPRPGLVTRLCGFFTSDGPPGWHEWRAAECARKADDLEEQVKAEIKVLIEQSAEHIVVLRHLSKLHGLRAEQLRQRGPQ